MLTKLIKRVMGKQKLIQGIGEFKETLAQALFWFTILNVLMVGGTFYYTTLRHIAPWFSLEMFVGAIVIATIVIFIVEYKFIVPSIWAFRGRQMDLRKGVKQNGKPVVVAVSGGFDPLNGKGHLTHIQEAKKLGDKLVVILSRNDQLVAKGNKPNGTFYPDIKDRLAIIRELRSVDEVVVNMDPGSECAETLRMVMPDIFANGGDRVHGTMPQCELDTCKEIGCRIVYNVGNPKTTSSSELVRRAADDTQ